MSRAPVTAALSVEAQWAVDAFNRAQRAITFWGWYRLTRGAR